MITAPKRTIRRRRVIAAVAIALVLASVLFINRGTLRTVFDQVAGNDYVGNGVGVTSFTVNPGETGSTIAQGLVSKGIVKKYETVYRLMLSQKSRFYPGTYKMHSKMSSLAALNFLANPSNLQITRVTIQEGLRISQVLQKLATATGIPLANFEIAAKNLSALGIPKEAPNAEGFLYPATYEFAAKSSAEVILKTMVDRCFQELDRFSVPKTSALKILILASIVQKEARQPSDFYKVSRVFTNRLGIGMPLQSDATVSYGSGGTTVTTTDAERASSNGYNTYVKTGLPIGPISAPGSMAIDAALHPVEGKWLFFCAINLQTGETVFSETVTQHEIAVAKFRAWMLQNPGWNG